MAIVKICRVTDIHTARLCGDLRVDMIGLHAIHGLDATQEIAYARIVKELREFYPETVPVLVTKITEASELSACIAKTGITRIQLHIPLRYSLLKQLISDTETQLKKKLEVIATVGAEEVDAAERLQEFDGKVDFVLIDTSYRGGTGRQVEPSLLAPLIAQVKLTPVLIAGGLNTENVGSLVRLLSPHGVDVQTGLERKLPKHAKDPLQLVQFVDNARFGKTDTHMSSPLLAATRSLVSLAVTQVAEEALAETINKFKTTDIDLIHADFSDGSIASRFQASPLRAVEMLEALAPCLPYDVHLFLAKPDDRAKAVKECLVRNPLMRVALLHFLDSMHFSEEMLQEFIALTREVKTGVGIVIQATRFSIGTLEEVLTALALVPIDELSLITHSRSHSLEEVRAHDLPLLKLIDQWVQSRQLPTLVSVDRDMTVEKLGVLSAGRPNHAVVGSALLTSKDPQDMITMLRNQLTPPFLSNAHLNIQF